MQKKPVKKPVEVVFKPVPKLGVKPAKLPKKGK